MVSWSIRPGLAVRSLLFTLAFCLGGAAGAQAQDVFTEVSPARMTRILTSMGLDVKPLEDVPDGKQPPLLIELAGYRTLVFLLNDNTDAQLYVGFRKQISSDKMNDWNRDHRFARAYRDNDGEAVLEADLDFVGGVTEEGIKAWVRLYRDLVVQYAKYVN